MSTTLPIPPAGNAYADTINGLGIALSSLGASIGSMAYVASSDANGTPALFIARNPSPLPAVDHVTVEAIAGRADAVWIIFQQLA